MKVYKCDSCGKMIENPYEEKMKEFYVGCEFDYYGVFPVNTKQKIKVDLCEDCYRGLHSIAENKSAFERIARINAIKEFAERLEEHLKGNGGLYCVTTMNAKIDNLVKEMVGEDK